MLHSKEMVFCSRRFAAILCMRCGRSFRLAHIENVILHQDNAPCHTTRNTLLEIDVLGFQQAIHQPYSMDLAPLDFLYFLT